MDEETSKLAVVTLVVTVWFYFKYRVIVYYNNYDEGIGLALAIGTLMLFLGAYGFLDATKVHGAQPVLLKSNGIM
jgi:hypothetical protein